MNTFIVNRMTFLLGWMAGVSLRNAVDRGLKKGWKDLVVMGFYVVAIVMVIWFANVKGI